MLLASGERSSPLTPTSALRTSSWWIYRMQGRNSVVEWALVCQLKPSKSRRDRIARSRCTSVTESLTQELSRLGRTAGLRQDSWAVSIFLRISAEASHLLLYLVAVGATIHRWLRNQIEQFLHGSGLLRHRNGWVLLNRRHRESFTAPTWYLTNEPFFVFSHDAPKIDWKHSAGILGSDSSAGMYWACKCWGLSRTQRKYASK